MSKKKLVHVGPRNLPSALKPIVIALEGDPARLSCELLIATEERLMAGLQDWDEKWRFTDAQGRGSKKHKIEPKLRPEAANGLIARCFSFMTDAILVQAGRLYLDRSRMAAERIELLAE